MSDDDIRQLLADRAIEQVEPDAETAAEELAVARNHLKSAELISDQDPSGAFAMGYDAMRKAISAHMRARGYRATKGPGRHYRTGRYALAALDSLDAEEHVEAFDDLRRLRNQSEYDALRVESDEVAENLAHAHALVRAIEEDLAP
jgi:DNA integrity scanning protein DisA with diadenylate cyclase activity